LRGGISMAKRQFIIEFDDDDEYIVETLEELEQCESFHIVVVDPVLLSWSTAEELEEWTERESKRMSDEDGDLYIITLYRVI